MDRESKLTIFEYSDYRRFLADTYAHRKANSPGYSHRVFAKQAGLSSPSHLLMIVNGTRNLSLKTIPKFVDGLKLGTKEKRYFELLVLFNQSEDLQMKAKYFSEMMLLKGSLKRLHGLEKERFAFLSKWYVVAIYVMIDLKDFRNEPAWIARRLGGAITPAQAKDALENLHLLDLVESDANGGLRQKSGAITVADDTRSVAVFSYHQSMIRLASDALRTKHSDLREMNGATITIPVEKLPELKEKIRAFRKEINQLASSYKDPDQVYQLNIQLFPLSTSETK